MSGPKLSLEDDLFRRYIQDMLNKLDDPKQISKEGSWKWKNGNTGHTYKVPLNKNFDVDYVKFLIKQKYNNLSQ